MATDSVEDTWANVRFAFHFLRFDFCDARIAFPDGVRLLGSLTLDAFPIECLSPICDPPCHGVKAESLSDLVNQSSPVRMVYRSCGACRARGGADLRRGSHRRACGDAGRGHRLYRQQRASTPCSHEAAPIRPERRLWSQEAFNAVSRQPIKRLTLHGLLRKPTAPAFKARSRMPSSAKPVMKMIGMR